MSDRRPRSSPQTSRRRLLWGVGAQCWGPARLATPNFGDLDRQCNPRRDRPRRLRRAILAGRL